MLFDSVRFDFICIYVNNLNWSIHLNWSCWFWLCNWCVYWVWYLFWWSIFFVAIIFCFFIKSWLLRKWRNILVVLLLQIRFLNFLSWIVIIFASNFLFQFNHSLVQWILFNFVFIIKAINLCNLLRFIICICFCPFLLFTWYSIYFLKITPW